MTSSIFHRPFIRYSILFLIALGIRLFYLSLYIAPGGWDAVGQSSEVGFLASNLADGRGFSSPFGPGSSPSAWIAPFVPALWALFFKLTGTWSDLSLSLVYTSNALARAAAILLEVHIACFLLHKKDVSTTWWFWVIGILFAVWPEHRMIITPPWYYPFQELSIALVFWQSLRFFELPSTGRAVQVGATIGIGCLVNPLFLPWIGLSFLAWSISHRGKMHFAKVILAGAVAGICILPWTYRNYLALGGLVPLRANFGVELYQGNNPNGAIMQTRESLHPMLNRDERSRYESLGEYEYARQSKEQAIAYLQEHPFLTVKRMLLRAYIFWCTDLFDQYPFYPRPPYWKNGVGAIVKKFITASVYLIPLAAALFGLLRGHLQKMPYAAFFLSYLILIPLPYYLTISGLGYTHVVQPWLLLTVVVSLLLPTRSFLSFLYSSLMMATRNKESEKS